MIVTCLEFLEGAKVKVYLDQEYAFLLYKNDIKRLKLEEEMELSQELYDKIIEETIYRRAKQKAMTILQYRDQSEQELRKKLVDTGYPDFIVDRAIEYVYSYHYLDDERYASHYVRVNKNTKSKKIIKVELQRKGINSEVIDNILEEEFNMVDEEDPERIAIERIVQKKTSDVTSLTWEEKQKLMAKIYRKGFELDKIKKILYNKN